MYLQCLWSEQMKKILSFLTVSKGILLAGKNDIFMMKLKWDRKFLTTDALKLKSANSEVMDINRNRDAAIPKSDFFEGKMHVKHIEIEKWIVLY